MTRALSYKDFLKNVKLTWRDRLDQPSIQLAEWAEKTLPPGTYDVHLREDGTYEVRTGPGSVIWPVPSEIPVTEPPQPEVSGTIDMSGSSSLLRG